MTWKMLLINKDCLPNGFSCSKLTLSNITFPTKTVHIVFQGCFVEAIKKNLRREIWQGIVQFHVEKLQLQSALSSHLFLYIFIEYWILSKNAILTPFGTNNFRHECRYSKEEAILKRCKIETRKNLMYSKSNYFFLAWNIVILCWNWGGKFFHLWKLWGLALKVV